jgi:putative Ig domain-containing protein
MQNRLSNLGTVIAAAITVVCAGSFVGAQSSVGITPWDVGDVFVGVGSVGDAGGTYRTLAPTGLLKLDRLGLDPLRPVPDLVDTVHDFASGCTVDPTAPNGDMWTTTWTGMVLHRFSAQTHLVVNALPLQDPATFVNTPLARLPRAAGVPPLPLEAIGVADDPLTAADESRPPDIQAFEQVVFARDRQFYVGTQTPMYSTQSGLGHAYLLRFRFDAAALPGAEFTLTGWWRVDAGAIADRSAERQSLYDLALAANGGSTTAAAADVADANIADGTSRGATGVDQFDLSSDQKTIFYTSEDDYIRVYDTATGQQKPSIRMTSLAGRDANGNGIWEPLGTRAYGIRALPTGSTDPLQAGDGREGFLVATARGMVFRLDKDGHVIDSFAVPGLPFAINLTPDAQQFWTATTQNWPPTPTPTGGLVYRFHIASHRMYGPFTTGSTAAYGLCVKREYVAADGVCFAMNPDGTAQVSSNGQPIRIPCQTPARCWPDPMVTGVGYDGQPNAACFPPGEVQIAAVNQDNYEGDPVNVDVSSANPGITFTGATGLPSGIRLTAGTSGGFTTYAFTGTVGWDACNNALPDPCALHVLLYGAAPSGDASRTEFVWTIRKRDAVPVLTPPPPTTIMAQRPASLPLFAYDEDAQEALIVRVSGQPAGMVMQSRIGYGTGYALALSGTPQAEAAYPHTYTVTVDLFDCDATWANANVPGPTVPTTAGLDAATSPGGPCFHRVTRTFTVTVITPATTVTAANQSSMVNVALPSPYYFCAAGPCGESTPAGHPLSYSVTGGALPAGLSLDAATGRISGTPTVPVDALPVTITVRDTTTSSAATTSFTWTVTARPSLTVADQTSMVNVALPSPYYVCPTGPCAASTPAGHVLAYAVTAGALPAGLVLNPATGQVTGTPTLGVLAQPVTITVRDTQNGLTRTKSFTWTILTNRAPVCSAATVTPQQLWPPNHQFVPFMIKNVIDPDGDHVTLTITAITQDQPVDGRGDGNTPFDAIGVGFSTGAVRAERSGDLRAGDDGRLYQIDFTASDGKAGGSCSGTVYIGVPHDQGQFTLPTDNGCRWDSIDGRQLTSCAWLASPAIDARRPEDENR